MSGSGLGPVLAKPSTSPAPKSSGRLCKHKHACHNEALKAFSKCFLLGTALKTVLGLIKYVFARRRGSVWKLLDYRFGLFLGTLSASQTGISCLMRRLRKRDDVWTPVVAGGLSSASLVIADPGDRASLALYMFVRAAECVVRVWSTKSWFPHWAANFEHWDTVLMGLTAREILYAYMFEQHYVDPSYMSFLRKHGAKAQNQIEIIRRHMSFEPYNVRLLTDFMLKNKQTSTQLLDRIGNVNPCQCAHPHMNCVTHAGWFFAGGLRRALGVYLPVHGLYTLVTFVRGKKTFEQLLKTIKRFASNVWWSSAFLSLYCTLAWVCMCFQTRVLCNRSQRGIYQLLFIPGLATLLDQKSRRLELALYCMPRALEIVWQRYIGRSIPFGEYGLFCLAMMGLRYCFDRHPESLKSTLRAGINFIWRK